MVLERPRKKYIEIEAVTFNTQNKQTQQKQQLRPTDTRKER